MLEFIHFMSISREEDAIPKAHAPLVKTALDANTATKKAELAVYAGDKFHHIYFIKITKFKFFSKIYLYLSYKLMSI